MPEIRVVCYSESDLLPLGSWLAAFSRHVSHSYTLCWQKNYFRYHFDISRYLTVHNEDNFTWINMCIWKKSCCPVKWRTYEKTNEQPCALRTEKLHVMLAVHRQPIYKYSKFTKWFVSQLAPSVYLNTRFFICSRISAIVFWPWVSDLA